MRRSQAVLPRVLFAGMQKAWLQMFWDLDLEKNMARRMHTRAQLGLTHPTDIIVFTMRAMIPHAHYGLFTLVACEPLMALRRHVGPVEVAAHIRVVSLEGAGQEQGAAIPS